MADDMDHDSGRSSPVLAVTVSIIEKALVDLDEDTDIIESGNDVIKSVDAAQKVLQRSFVESELVTNLKFIEKCLTENTNEQLLKYTEEIQLHQQVISALKHVPVAAAVQQVGLHILYLLCEKCDSLVDNLVTCNIQSFLVEQLTSFRPDTLIQTNGIGILVHLLSRVRFRDQLLIDNQEEEVARVICVTFQTFPEDHILRCACAQAVCYLLTEHDDNKELRDYIGKQIGESVIELLHQDQQSITLIQTLHCLYCHEDNKRMTLVEKDVHFILMELCTKYPNHSKLMSEVTNLLSVLSAEEAVQRIMVSNSFVQNGLFAVMDTLQLSEKVQRAGLRMIEILIPKLLEDTTKADEVARLVVKSVHTAMLTQIQHVAVQIAGCRTLTVLLEHRPDAHKWIGDNLDEKQNAVHTLCVGAMLAHRKDYHVFVAVCETIFWIAADNERLCTSLMYKNVHVAITDGLKRHHDRPVAVETGCRALRGLCIFLHSHKEAIVRDDMFPFLTQLQQDYKDNIGVQIEVLSSIACLADVDVIRHQCFVEMIPTKVIESMRTFIDEPMIQETGLEAFAVLAGAEGGPELLMNAGVLDVALETMMGFKENVFIIKKGLIVLQLLAMPNRNIKYRTRKNVVSVLSSALKDFPDIKGVQSEACVAIQLHAESDSKMSKAFVDAGCHENLFQILEYDSTFNSELQELSSECLYVLSQEQNLKSIMLLSACKNGTLPATECLIELGADVNFGENFNSPLFVAVSNQHEKVVKCLLKQDIQDLKTPLKQSLRQESHVISGLLLQQMGYDKENSVICWNNLELESLEDKWILTTLTNSVTKSLDTDVGRFYIDNIKNSEVRRRKRKLAYSHSDSSLKYPHVRLRHKIVYEQRRTDIEIPPKILWKSDYSPRVPVERLLRSKSVDGTSSSPMVSKRPTLPTIIASSPDGATIDTLEMPEFEFSQTTEDDEEWREMTLSGAGVFYSSQDPRLQPSPKLRRNTSESAGLWKRKRERSMKTGSTSSEEGSPALTNRKMSAPNLSVDFKQISRQTSAESTTSEVKPSESNKRRSVHWLDVSENSIPNITALVSQNLASVLTNLDTLDIKCNKIKYLPEDLQLNMPHLHILDAAYNEIEEFPDTLLRSTSLIELRLGTNQIKELTLTFSNTSLEKLDLSRNQLKRLPEDEDGCNLRHFHNMREICLAHNDLMALPEKPIGAKELQSLDLSHNQIDCLPNLFLFSCTKLETLDLSYNILTRLPDEEYAENLPMLYKLKVRHNHLAEKPPFFIPRFILELSSIRTVDISENQILGFPSLTLWKTRTMKDFIANRNKIPILNLKDSKVWSKLEKLHVAHNYLTQLPQEIGSFTSLISLDISHNKITSLPDELGKCSKLYEMPTDGLELNISRVIMGRRVKDIIKYLHNRLTKAQRYYRMKLMVVGYGGRGKTTLLKTLMKEKVNKKENRPTVGVVVKDWVYSQYEPRYNEDAQSFKLLGSGKKVQYTLNTWDFAGQEEFYSTHDCYLANRAVYLVVFDLRKGPSECEILKTWLLSIRTRAPGCPVIIVGTHLDKLPDHRKEVMQVTEMIREFNIRPGYPSINSVYLVNAQIDNEDMECLRNDIKKTVDTFTIRGMRVIGEKIPSSYVELSEVLTAKAKSPDCKYPVIQHRELMDLVQKHKILLEDDEIPQAVQFLHEVGVLLHYDDASLKLRDYYFIDPGWLCRMMAQIITVHQINPFINKEGILRKRDIKVLFKGEASFPESLIPQYIKLLEKFEIALPHSETELMIPCRLPNFGPNIHPPGQSKIVRIYRMPYVPIGLWFRLIARLVTMTTHAGFMSIMNLGKPQKTVYWRRGVYIYYSEFEYFLLDSSTDECNQTDSIQVTVPSSSQGSRLLGQIIDSLDTLIDEWYPGLTCIDPLKGEGVLDIIVPCCQCSTVSEMAYTFSIKDLRATASKQDHIYCPQHEDDVLLRDIAPDLVMGDLEPVLKLDTNQFEFAESSDKQLGDGSFGEVYRATYKNKEVAVKVFKEIAEVHALTLLRQEATILRVLKHPSVVCIVAVGIRPPVIVMELAPHGTLGSLFKTGRDFKRALQHRVALQVAAGLKYLHSIMVVFRDMKPENVLIFNTSLDATINAKISDYGIARITTLQGLRAQEGTPGYRAPEVVRKENYSFEADVFSYGLTMYVMMTGRHPFDYMDSRGEMDKAVGEGLSFPPPESKTSAVVWPDMKAVIMSCLSYDPKDRLSSEDVWQTLRRPEIIGLHRIIPVSRATTVECLCVEEVNNAGRRDLRLWIASGDSETFQLSYKLVSDLSSDTRGLLFNYGRILCMQSLGNNKLALGTQIGKVWIFDTKLCKILHASAQLQDSVLCMNFVKSDQEGGVLLVGLANGKVAICPVHELLEQADMDPVCLYPGHEHEPVLCMTMLGKRVFLSCGTQIVVLNTSKMIAIDKIIDTAEFRNPSSAPIYTMAVLKGQIIFTKKTATVVEIWDASKEKVQVCFNVAEKFGIDKTAARVTSMIVDNSCLWIGTHGGHIGIVNVKTLNVLAVTQRYRRAVRSLVQIRERGSSRKGAVFSGGQGFKEITKPTNNDRDECGCVLVWDADFPHHAKSMIEYEQRRRDIQLMDENYPNTLQLVDSGSE